MSSPATISNPELPAPPEEVWWTRPRHLIQWPIHFAFREERFFLILSVFIGILSALAVVCFRLAIDFIRLRLLGPHLAPTGPHLLWAPAVAGLIVAVLVLHIFPAVRGSGVNQTKSALYIYNGYIPFRTAIGKFITASLAIGSGLPWDQKIRPCRLAPVSPPSLAGAFDYRGRNFASLPLSVPPPD